MQCCCCGREIPDDAIFCQYCGEKQDASASPFTEAGERTAGEGDEQAAFLSAARAPEPPYPPGSAVQTPLLMGMKWYHFIVKVQLRVYMLFAVLHGFAYMSGSQYASTQERNMVYSVFPAVKSIDTAYGLALLAMAVFAFITRQRLVQFLASGPKFYIAFSYIMAFMPLLYELVLSMVTWIPLTKFYGSDKIVERLVFLAMAIINTVYFNKRKALFR